MFKKIISRYIIGWLFFLAVAHAGSSQETSSYYLLPAVSQKSFFNPAIQNESKNLVIGLPFFSGISADWGANVPFDALFSKDFSYSFKRFYNELEPEGIANASVRVAMFYASLQHNDYTFRLSVTERMFVAGKFDRDIVKIIRDGIMPYYGTNENFGEADINIQYFRELSFGISKKFWETLDVGIASKILFGKLMAEGSGIELSVKTTQPDSILLVKPEGNFTATGPFTEVDNRLFLLSNIYPGDYFFQPRNLGLALDIGLVYQPNEYTELSASLLDLGFTTYKYNTFNLDLANPARYSKNDLFQSNYPDNDYYLEPKLALLNFKDSLSNIIDSDEVEERTLMLLPITLNLSGKYQFAENFTGGINNQFVWLRNQPRNYLAAFIQSHIGKRLELAGSLSLYNLASIRPGFGISWTLPKTQFYFSSNNILGIIQPTSAKHLNLSFGMNFLFNTQQ